MIRSYHKNQLSWAMYDWGNSAYATAVMAGFFPIFFKEYFSYGVETSVSTGYLGFANSLASLFIFILAPILGTYSDLRSGKKLFLSLFAGVGIFSTLGLAFIGRGDYFLASVVYGISSIGFMGGNLFYDALINNVCEKEELDKVSTLGYSLGYLGGGILFLITVVIVQNHEILGIELGFAIKLSFTLTALWWAVFALPLLRFVKEKKTKTKEVKKVFSKVWSDLKTIIIEVKGYKKIVFFLFAYWFYIDGVDTVIKMAVDFGLSIGLVAGDMIAALLLIQFVGFPATFFVGRLTRKFPTRKVLLGLIGVYFVIIIGGYFMTTKEEFFALALLIALSQGGIQALSRSYYASIIPKESSGEFFGFYNMIGKFASIFGPLLVGGVTLAFHDNRLGMLSLALLFIVGATLLYKQMRRYP